VAALHRDPGRHCLSDPGYGDEKRVFLCSR
jgi:hypothetical protein